MGTGAGAEAHHSHWGPKGNYIFDKYTEARKVAIS